MIALIAKLFSGTVLDRLTSLYEKKLTADTDAKKLAVDLVTRQLEADVAGRQNAKEIRMATAGFWEMRLITFMIAMPFAVHEAAVVYDTLDTSVNLAIPALPYPFSEWQGVVLLSFFGVQVAGKAMDTLAFIFRKK